MISRFDSANSVRVAVAQTAPELGANARNLERLVARLEEAALQGARLVVFPECALSGYMLDGIEELHRLAEPVLGPSISRIAEVCARQRVHTVVGLLEQEADAFYNSAALVGPEGLHRLLPESPSAGARARSHGGAWQHSFRRARYANRAYGDGDLLRHPISRADATARAARRRHRCLPLQLAAVVERLAPPSAIPDVLTRARAIENRVFLAVADRAGVERSSRFLGCSQLVDVFGKVVAEAGSGEELLWADFDLALARRKDFVYAPGRFETHWFADRRTDLYGPLTDAELWPQSARRLSAAPRAA